MKQEASLKSSSDIQTANAISNSGVLTSSPSTPVSTADTVEARGEGARRRARHPKAARGL